MIFFCIFIGVSFLLMMLYKIFLSGPLVYKDVNYSELGSRLDIFDIQGAEGSFLNLEFASMKRELIQIEKLSESFCIIACVNNWPEGKFLMLKSHLSKHCGFSENDDNNVNHVFLRVKDLVSVKNRLSEFLCDTDGSLDDIIIHRLYFEGELKRQSAEEIIRQFSERGIGKL